MESSSAQLLGRRQSDRNGCNIYVNICQVDLLLPNPVKGKPPLVVYPGECYYCGSCVAACPKKKAIWLNPPLMHRARW